MSEPGEQTEMHSEGLAASMRDRYPVGWRLVVIDYMDKEDFGGDLPRLKVARSRARSERVEKSVATSIRFMFSGFAHWLKRERILPAIII